MTPERERYRKLPGHRRGIIHGASVWMGSDHLLSVKSWRFREEYKKFYLRDIQAITVASAPRFHISSRAVAIGALWAFAWPFVLGIRAGAGLSLIPILWTVMAIMAAIWLVVSAAFSCRCRIFTAVSSEELPSVYRTWTARRFLAAIEPKIAEVQGIIEGQWAEAAEDRKIGVLETVGPDGAALPIARPARGRSHTTLSDIFIGTLFASGVADLLTQTQSIWGLFLLLKIAGATAVFIQHYQGVLKPAMQRLAIVVLAVTGAMYYVELMAGQFAAAQQAKANNLAQFGVALKSGNRLFSEISAGASILLGCIGLAIILLSHDGEETVPQP